MRVQFVHRNVLNTVVILEEGNLPHPCCALCDMLVPRQVLNGRHPDKAQCANGAERKRRLLAEAETWESLEKSSEAYGEPINNLLAFNYMVRVLTAGDGDCLAVVGNLGKTRRIWGWLSQVLGREWVDPKVSGNFYKAVAQAVLLFGAEMWVLTQRMEKALDRFQSRDVSRLTGRQLRRNKYGIWDYLPLAEALM